MKQGETTIKLPLILRLPSPNKDSFHLYALQTYLTFLLEVLEGVPSLYLLNDDDLGTFLSDTEYARFRACQDEITEWLKKCAVDNDKASLDVYPYHSPFSAMRGFKELLKQVYERKVVKARQEAEKKRRLAALKEIDPPFDDGEKYLNKDEQQKFLDSLPGAVDAYLEGRATRSLIPNAWLLNRRAWDYALWISTIRDRKREVARRRQAKLEYDQFVMEINDGVKKLKQELAKGRKPSFGYPPWLAQYHPDTWFEPKLPTEQEIEKWAEPYIRQRVPQALKGFISWEASGKLLRLPYAEYEVVGVPCFTWCFRTMVLVSVHLWLAESEFTRDFQGYSYEVKVKAEDLGSLSLGPVEWACGEGFTTPLALLSLLATGKLEGDGIEVVGKHGSSIVFSVRGYDEGLTEVDEMFRRFIVAMAKAKPKPLAQALLEAGIADEITAQLVKEKAALSLPQQEGAPASAGGGAVDNSDVIAALAGLGYKKAEIKGMVEATQFSPGMSIEEKVKAVLKNKGPQKYMDSP